MKTFVILGLLLVLVMPTTALAQSPLQKEGSGTMDAVIGEDGNIDAATFGLPSSRGADDAAGSYVLPAILLVQGIALAFVLWTLFGRLQRRGATLRRAFTCPFRGRAVIAEFELDGAERPIDVVWCTAFRPPVVVECRKRCLRMRRILHSARRERRGAFGVLHATGRRLSALARGQAR